MANFNRPTRRVGPTSYRNIIVSDRGPKLFIRVKDNDYDKVYLFFMFSCEYLSTFNGAVAYVLRRPSITLVIANRQTVKGLLIFLLRSSHSRANARVVYFRVVKSTTGYTFIPCAVIFTSPGIDTTLKGPTASLLSPPKVTRQSGVNGIAKVPKRSDASRIRTRTPRSPVLRSNH